MPTTVKNDQVKGLEDEVRELEHEELELERRTEKIQWTQGLTLSVAVLAFIVAGVAVAFAFAAYSKDSSTKPAAPAAGSAAGMPGPAMRGGGGAAAMPRSAAGSRTVNVQLGEMWVKPNMSSISAGKVTFDARNVGAVTHELMIERMPIKLKAPGQPVEEAAMGMVEDMEPGKTGHMSLRLKPGRYELFCNVPGHYAAGQHTAFTVTS